MCAVRGVRQSGECARGSDRLQKSIGSARLAAPRSEEFRDHDAGLAHKCESMGGAKERWKPGHGGKTGALVAGSHTKQRRAQALQWGALIGGRHPGATEPPSVMGRWGKRSWLFEKTSALRGNEAASGRDRGCQWGWHHRRSWSKKLRRRGHRDQTEAKTQGSLRGMAEWRALVSGNSKLDCASSNVQPPGIASLLSGEISNLSNLKGVGRANDGSASSRT